MEPASAGTTTLVPLTRKDFYELTDACRTYALELASRDQSRVSLKHCHEFNQWLDTVRSYEQLAPVLRTLKRARPVARWQVMTLAAVFGLVVMLAVGSELSPSMRTLATPLYFFSLLILYFVPERLYGTTIEHIEGKVLRVVEAMEALLLDGSMGFTDAAFFNAKENLRVARKELRQQLDLAHRARSGSFFGW